MNAIEQQHIILASQSPRRRQMLEQMGLKLDIRPADVDESNGKNLLPKEFVEYLSRLKAQAVMDDIPDAWVIGADTIVVADDRILGKPRDNQQAVEMLKFLSGREHFVYTGFTIGNIEKQIITTQTAETRVRFKPLSDSEIQWYARTNEPYDKAGGYGIQGKGGFMVASIEGSYTNVVGLPLCKVIDALVELGVIKF